MEQKEYLDLSCRFARRKFYDKEKKKYTHYISGETVVDEEKIRFKLNDKDSRLFQYMLKKMGLIERDMIMNVYMHVMDEFKRREAAKFTLFPKF